MIAVFSLIWLCAAIFLIRRNGLRPSTSILIIYCAYGVYFSLMEFLGFTKATLIAYTTDRLGFPVYFTAGEISSGAEISHHVQLLYIFCLSSLGLSSILASRVIGSMFIGKLTRSTGGQSANGSRLALLRLLIISVITIFTLLVVVHVFSIEWGRLAYFTDYQELKHPEGLGLDSSFLRAAHFIIKLGGAPVFALGVMLFKRLPGHSVVLIFVSMYPFVFNLVTSSRLIVLYPILLSVLFLGRGRRINSTISLVIGFIFLGFVVIRRNATEMGYETIDAEIFMVIFFNFDIFLLGAAVNTLDLVSQLAEVSHRVNDWPILYKILSFSPLPSSIDGFRSVADAELRVNFFVPYSALAEAYFFGSVYFLVFISVLCLLVLLTDLVSGLKGPHVNAMLIMWVLLLNQFVAQYPIRNSFRLIIFTICISIIIVYLEKRRARG